MAEENNKYKVNSTANQLLSDTSGRGTLEKDFSKRYVYVPKRKKPFNKKIPASIVLLAVLFWMSYRNIKILSSGECMKVENILTELKNDRPICKRLDTYVHYIFSRYGRKGPKGLEGKWAKSVPEYFKISSCKRFKKLQFVTPGGLEGFNVKKFYMDNNVVYVLKCVTFSRPSKVVFVYVVREKLGCRHVFRILKVD